MKFLYSICPIPYDTDAWNVFGVGIGQGEIIGFGLAAGTASVVGYRALTRGKRYDGD